MFESRRTKTTIILLGIATVAIASFTLMFMSSATQMQSSGSTQANSNSVPTSSSVVRGPPAPLPLSIWGHQDTLDNAKNVTGMSWVSLPAQVPPNLTLAPIRMKTDPRATVISAIYVPSGVDTSDNVTGDQIANSGSLSVTYWKQIGSPGANLTKNMLGLVKEFPNSTSLDTINGHQALIFPNEIQINVGNCMNETNCWLMIDIGSRTLNSVELRSIAESITIPPHI
jgi:hypothetical protein